MDQSISYFMKAIKNKLNIYIIETLKIVNPVDLTEIAEIQKKNNFVTALLGFECLLK